MIPLRIGNKSVYLDECPTIKYLTNLVSKDSTVKLPIIYWRFCYDDLIIQIPKRISPESGSLIVNNKSHVYNIQYSK